MNAPIVLAAGGTGGHLFPAEALARALLERQCRVALVTDRRGQAFGDKLPDIELHRIRAGRFGAGLVSKVVAGAELALGTLEAHRLLRRLAPAAVVGFGGYPSVPPMLAAARLGLPTLIHEQNAILGRANRLLAPRAKRIATSFTEVGAVRNADRARIVETGNPVRPTIAALRGAPYPMPSLEGPFEILIIGGSQGARVLSEVVPAALAQLPEPLRSRLRLTQQARAEDIDAVRRAHQASGVAAALATFFADIPEREMTRCARALEKAGGAWVMGQATITPAALGEKIMALMTAPTLLADAAAKAHALGRPDAAWALADLVLSLARNGHPVPRKDAA